MYENGYYESSSRDAPLYTYWSVALYDTVHRALINRYTHITWIDKPVCYVEIPVLHTYFIQGFTLVLSTYGIFHGHSRQFCVFDTSMRHAAASWTAPWRTYKTYRWAPRWPKILNFWSSRGNPSQCGWKRTRKKFWVPAFTNYCWDCRFCPIHP